MLVQNVANQGIHRHDVRSYSLLALAAVLGSGLFSRPNEWSNWRQAFNALVVRRCWLSNLLLLPCCLRLDFASGAPSLAPSVVTSFCSLRSFFDPGTWSEIQSLVARSVDHVLVVEEVGPENPTIQVSLLPVLSREDVASFGVRVSRIDTVLRGYRCFERALSEAQDVTPFLDFFARDLISYLLVKESTGNVPPRSRQELPALDFSVFVRPYTELHV